MNFIKIEYLYKSIKIKFKKLIKLAYELLIIKKYINTHNIKY